MKQTEAYKLTLVIVEFDAGSGGRPAENGFARDGPDALFGALLDEDQTIGWDTQQTVRLADSTTDTAAKVIDRHLPADGATLDAIGIEFWLETFLLPTAERQDGEFGAAVEGIIGNIVCRQILTQTSNKG